ncbi:uncharacterized protein LOC129226478 [Uloborus diversus]|uniref:uncharacterized protein LOC129226478 n=1 Tax=Uloborus diversus TaxID=327109 RepID=UPI00240A737F|nr:uncharacterized protein LOC129226478 [Uloborus diversus]
MRSVLTSVLLLCLVSFALCQGYDDSSEDGGRGPPRGGRGRGPPPGRGGGRGGPPPMFPECEEFEKAVRKEAMEMHRNKEGGPRNCQSENRQECRYNDMMTARSRVTVEPSPECLNQVDSFFRGNANASP